MATTFAGQAAVALDNANLYEDSLGRAAELDERSQRLALLNRFSSALSGLLEAGQILQLTADELRHALNARQVSAVVYGTWAGALGVGFARPRAEPAAHCCRMHPCLPACVIRWAYSTPRMRASEPDLRPLGDFIQQDVKSLLVLPLVSGQELRALMFAQAVGERHFSLTEIELARTIANQASIALENARLYESTVRTAERFAILNQVSAEIGGSLEPEEIYASIHRAVGTPHAAGSLRHQPAG